MCMQSGVGGRGRWCLHAASTLSCVVARALRSVLGLQGIMWTKWGCSEQRPLAHDPASSSEASIEYLDTASTRSSKIKISSRTWLLAGIGASGSAGGTLKNIAHSEW